MTNERREALIREAHEMAYDSCDPEGDIFDLLVTLEETKRKLAEAERARRKD